MCCFHWLSKQNCLGLLIGQPLDGQTRQNRMLGKRQAERAAMEPAATSDMLNVSW